MTRLWLSPPASGIAERMKSETGEESAFMLFPAEIKSNAGHLAGGAADTLELRIAPREMLRQIKPRNIRRVIRFDESVCVALFRRVKLEVRGAEDAGLPEIGTKSCWRTRYCKVQISGP